MQYSRLGSHCPRALSRVFNIVHRDSKTHDAHIGQKSYAKSLINESSTSNQTKVQALLFARAESDRRQSLSDGREPSWTKVQLSIGGFSFDVSTVFFSLRSCLVPDRFRRTGASYQRCTNRCPLAVQTAP
jgi:hypothetical protein